VNDKINSHQHQLLGSPLNRAEMLALILYTGCECNWYLCLSQRNKDFHTWKWFDYNLFYAIDKLHAVESGKYQIYTGIKNVNLKQEMIEGYFVTYVSTSWKRNVAEEYMHVKNDIEVIGGMIIEMNRGGCTVGVVRSCDVSWISKFPDECEILIQRGRGLNNRYHFTLGSTFKIKEQKMGFQVVTATNNIFRF
jgi:hypothetical protein